MKYTHIVCGAFLLALVSSQGPVIDDGCTPAHGVMCTYVTGVSHIAQGQWEACPNNGDIFCKDDLKFRVIADEYTMHDAGSRTSIRGNCPNNGVSIFQCTQNFWVANKEQPSSDFDYCCLNQNRRRLTGTSCWPASAPRLVSFVGAFMFYFHFSHQILFAEFMADDTAGCSGGQPIYKTRMSEYQYQYTLLYTGSRWEITTSDPNKASRLSYCTEANVGDCVSWASPTTSMEPSLFGVKTNERVACQYLEDTRDIKIHSTWLSNAGRFWGLPLPMSIQQEDRCFFSRPAWAGTVDDAYTAAGQTRPHYAPNSIFYISFEEQASDRWILSFDYIDYTEPIYECLDASFRDLKDCGPVSGWDWVWERNSFSEAEWALVAASNPNPMTLTVNSTGPVAKAPVADPLLPISRPGPVTVPVSPVSGHWGSSVNLLVASCTLVNLVGFAAHCMYKRQSEQVKTIDDSPL